MKFALPASTLHLHILVRGILCRPEEKEGIDGQGYGTELTVEVYTCNNFMENMKEH